MNLVSAWPQRAFHRAIISLLLCTCLGSIPPASAAPAPSRRLALLVGISNYDQHGPKPWPKLHTQKDTERMRAVLINRFGFKPADIKVVQDEAATAQGIRDAFRTQLIEQAVPGAVVVFHYAGHGQQVADDNGDELDGMDETLVPQDAHDQSAAAGAKVNIRDDEIGLWLKELQSRMSVGGKVQGSINIFLDSCFSGSATRGQLVERGRGWDEEIDGPRPQVRGTGKPEGGIGLTPQGDAAAQGYVLLSATQSDQTAKEVSESGAFTTALVSALASSTDRTTYRAVLDQVVVGVSTKVRDQTPELEGTGDNLIFGGAGPPAEPYLRVGDSDGETLTLPAGELHGVTAGSTYSIYRAGSEPMDEKTLLGEAQVQQIEPFSSTARLLPAYRKRAPASDYRAARAVEKIHSFDSAPLLVHLDGLQSQPALAGLLQRLDVINTKGVSSSNYQIQVRYQKGKNILELRRRESGTPFASIPADAQAAAQVEALLRGEWRWQHLAQLSQKNPYLDVALSILPVNAILNDRGKVASTTPRTDLKPGSDIRLHAGDYFMLSLTNKTDNDCYVTVLLLDQSGSIEPVFPAVGAFADNMIPRSQTVILPQPYIFVAGEPYGRGRLKIITTRDKVNFSMLMYQAVQPGGGIGSRGQRPAMAKVNQNLNPLAQLLENAALGGRGGSVTRVGMEPSLWATGDAWIDIAPAAKPANRSAPK